MHQLASFIAELLDEPASFGDTTNHVRYHYDSTVDITQLWFRTVRQRLYKEDGTKGGSLLGPQPGQIYLGLHLDLGSLGVSVSTLPRAIFVNLSLGRNNS